METHEKAPATDDIVVAALAVGGAALVLHVRHSITASFLGVCATACATDLADIGAHYTPAPVAFWVAARGAELVGFLGLASSARTGPQADHHAPATGELRRMIVAPRHRWRGIGTRLLAAALAHTRAHSSPPMVLELETSEFQPGAQRLYKRAGWVPMGTGAVRFGVKMVNIFGVLVRAVAARIAVV
ncbi:acyl-CoA N-acyltransferase [Mycena sp. CBHHK59/15]|nr:acyl-CoA N-acyltransferase [Mycena sp. CBHHK59/15]